MCNRLKATFLTLLSFISTAAMAQSYGKLWKQFESHQKAGKPKSAYAVTQSILHKAIAEQDMGQQLSARLMGASLQQEWARDSFFTQVAELEVLRQTEPRIEAKAVYASILAKIYQNNRLRSQARNLAMRSGEMREWTTEEYDSAAAANWRLSLSDIPALASAKTDHWLPFIAQNAHSRYFRHDLLHVLWQRALTQRQDIWSPTKEDLRQKADELALHYLSLGNREAALLVRLDAATLLSEGTSVAPLLSLQQTFADLPLCCEVYDALMRHSEATDSQRVAWGEEALSRYPRYERIAIIRNQLNELRRPSVSWSGHEIYYPGKTYTWKLTAKNAAGLQLKVLRLNESFRDEEMGDKPISYIRKHGKQVQLIRHSLKPCLQGKASHESVEDSLQWTAPEVGRYAILFTATTEEKESERKEVQDQFQLFRVSALKPLWQQSNEGTRFVVVDAESGQPVKGAHINIYEEAQNSSQRTLLQTLVTNAEGRALLKKPGSPRHSLTAEVQQGADKYLPVTDFYESSHQPRKEKEIHYLKLYTDRAIYRPGQTIHVGGVLYSQLHWDAHVGSHETVTITMRDANWKIVAQQEVSTDEMGTVATDFTLPANSLPGSYRLESDKGSSLTFRVEEYKRPTFEVSMDKAPALQWPQDSISLTGRATGYNGVPVRQGRVCGTFRFTYPYRWWFRHADSPTMPTDTVHTDEKGQFSVRIPLQDIPREALQYGLNIHFEAEVLSPAGETQIGTINVPLCTTPLRIRLIMNERQDRDRLKPFTIRLLTSTGKYTAGSIQWEVAPFAATLSQSTTGCSTSEEAPATILEALRALPSGEYDLRLHAQAGNDTASASQRFYLFSMTDTRLSYHAPDWFYCPADTFNAQHLALLQVGSSSEDVAFYYTLTDQNREIIEEKLIPLSNELRLIEIPYEERYGDGVSITTAFVKGGKLFTHQQTIRLPRPSTRLNYEWTSFRDHLHPGDKETWTLRLTRPDGSPASAQLMATLYDASLDALVPHSWYLFVDYNYNINRLYWQHQDFFAKWRGHESFYFPMKNYPSVDVLYDAVDERWMIGLSFSPWRNQHVRILGTRAYGTNAVEEVAMADARVYMTEAPKAMAAKSTAMAKPLKASQETERDGAETETTAAAAPTVRSNFNETAAFMPRLATNAQGEVSLSFTLPESLTTWQLLGVAHTADMQTAEIQAQVIAHKELMAQLYLPRFLRCGDQATLRATVQNLTEMSLSGKALLEIFDPATERVLSKQRAAFTAEANGESLLTFTYEPTEEPSLVAVRLTAETSSFSDGEQRLLPILPAKEWMTESVEIAADSLGTFTTDLSSLFNHNSRTATQRRLTVEYTTNPIWYALQALPALREPQHEDVLSLTTAIYANALASHIARSTPQLETMVRIWQQQGGKAQQSPLTQDEELKQILLNETPWLREAESDSERKASLIELYNDDLQHSRLMALLTKLTQRQEADGGFSWFPGMPSSEYMTRHVALMLTRLHSLTQSQFDGNEETAKQLNGILQQAVAYLTKENARYVQELRKAEAKGEKIQTSHLWNLHYLYIIQRSGVKLSNSQQRDADYLLEHLRGSVAGMDNEQRAMAAIVLKGANREQEALSYLASMKEHMTTTPKQGSFFDYAGGSFTSINRKLHLHTSAMEAVHDLTPSDTRLQASLRRWLLAQKRTQAWQSPMESADAIYALLHGNAQATATTQADRLTLNYAKRNVRIDVTTQAPSDANSLGKAMTSAGLGYVKEQFMTTEAPRSITVERRSPTAAWGAVYAQYLTPTADATSHAEGISIRRELSNTRPQVGERLTTRYIITADRDYEYVCLRADRAASTEPAEQLSGYRFQGGLGYYRAVRDARTEYFFDRLPKGTYVLEETAFTDRTGTYATGLCTIRCLYAPEYGGNTPEQKLEIK